MMARNTVLTLRTVAPSLPITVCAWCSRTLRTGNRDVSHGICHRCSRVLIAELDRPPAA